jgi:hypothetical protein
MLVGEWRRRRRRKVYSGANAVSRRRREVIDTNECR